MLTAQKLFEKARQEGFAIGAFNAGNLEIVKAIVAAAKSQQSPVIIETSAGETEFFGPENFIDVIKNFRKQTGLPILTNLDHAPGLEEAEKGLTSGYDLINFDGSDLPYEENVKISKEVVRRAHEKGVLVEAEADKILGESRVYEEVAESVQATGTYTDPEKAVSFIEATKADTLAIFVGNLHGVYKTPPKLDFERLKLIAQKLPCFLSLHGGSGIEEEQIKQAIKIGKIVKINVNTELRMVYRETLENILKGSEEIAIYRLMPPVIAAVQKVVEEKIQLFGSAGKT